MQPKPKFTVKETSYTKVRTLPGLELAADQFGQGLVRNEEASARCRPPIATVEGDPTAGNQAMHVWMVDELLRPGMEDGEHAGGAANVALIAGEFDDRLGGSLHQQRIPVALVGVHQRAQFLR